MGHLQPARHGSFGAPTFSARRLEYPIELVDAGAAHTISRRFTTRNSHAASTNARTRLALKTEVYVRDGEVERDRDADVGGFM
jgi:hypothetical protein